MSWTATAIHVLDFEGGRRSGVVEYGVVTLEQGAITTTQTRLCAPAGPVTASEIACHGIREAEVVGAAPFTAEQALFAALRQTGPFAAHHAPVERALLSRVWPVPPASLDFGADEPALSRRTADWGPWLDTRRLYECLYPGLSGYALMELIQTFSLTSELVQLAARHCPAARRSPHCALFDALAASLLLIRLTREPELATASLAWLLAKSAPASGEESLRQRDLRLD